MRCFIVKILRCEIVDGIREKVKRFQRCGREWEDLEMLRERDLDMVK